MVSAVWLVVVAALIPVSVLTTIALLIPEQRRLVRALVARSAGEFKALERTPVRPRQRANDEGVEGEFVDDSPRPLGLGGEF